MNGFSSIVLTESRDTFLVVVEPARPRPKLTWHASPVFVAKRCVNVIFVVNLSPILVPCAGLRRQNTELVLLFSMDIQSPLLSRKPSGK
jgi:hypothetical protein